MKQLRPYQKAALTSLLKAEESGIRRSLIVLPTGTGKTEIFARIPQFRKDSIPMLVLAHRKELLSQAKDKIERANPELKVAIEQGPQSAGKVDVVVASVPSLGRANSKRLAKYPKDYFKVIVTDEAHHAAATTYKRIYEYFDEALSVGVTATPQRGDKVGLQEVFDEVIFFKDILEMMNEGWLSPLVGYRVRSEIDLSDVHVVGGDFAEGELAATVNVASRNKLVVDSYKNLLGDKRTIVFAAGVDHAHQICDLFVKEGIAAATVTGETPADERTTILEKFSQGELKVVVNVGVLTEGFDEPSVQGIILARPTRSSLLYTQIIGRGTRLHPGKDHCVVVDIADVTRKTQPLSLPTLLGLPADFDLNGADVREAHDRFTEIAELAPTKAFEAKTFDDLNEVLEQINVFMPPEPDPMLLEVSPLLWRETQPGHYHISIDQTHRAQIWQTPLGDWAAQISARGERDIPIGTFADTFEAFRATDSYIRNNYEDKLAVLSVSAEWRKHAPTQPQIDFLKRKGLPIPPGLTKGQASEIISTWIERNPRSVAQQKMIDRAKAAKGF